MDHTPANDPDGPTLAAGLLRSPRRLVLVRHGESIGNLADRAAREGKLDRLDLDTRDPDTPLSDDGVAQAEALGEFLASRPDAERPDIVLTSPYVRARATAEAVLSGAGMDLPLVLDERLREREFGAFDRLTRQGINKLFPDEAKRLADLGKFYYRPPGGESWADVALRVRSVLGDIRSEYDDKVVWVFSHQAVIMVFRFVLEQLDEERVLEFNRSEPLPNCSLTSYTPGDSGGLELRGYGETGHIEASDAPVTAEEPAKSDG